MFWFGWFKRIETSRFKLSPIWFDFDFFLFGCFMVQIEPNQKCSPLCHGTKLPFVFQKWPQHFSSLNDIIL